MDATSHGLPLLEPASPDALLPDASWWPWLVAAAIAGILTLIITLILRKHPVAADPRATRAAARIEALETLATIGSSINVRNAAIQSSLVLRRYLASATGDPALYETHEEFVARHDALQALTPDARAAAQAGFAWLAALKYAPTPPDEAAAEVVVQARALLETLHHGLSQ